MRAEKHFPEVEGARQSGSNYKTNILGDLYLCSSLWGEAQNRYTGIHAFHVLGSVKPLTGVNLTEQEWNTFLENFSKIKDLLHGHQVNLSDCKRSFDYEETIKLYVAKWMLDGESLNPNAPEFYSEQEALDYARQDVPMPDADYCGGRGSPQLRLEHLSKPPPKDTDLMELIFVHHVDKLIQNEVKENCEACRVDSNSQFDHCRSGNCLDECNDFTSLYCEIARNKIKVFDLMNVFDGVRSKIGAKPVFSKQLVKAAMAWIPNSLLLKQLRKDKDVRINPLMDIVRNVHEKVVSQ